MSSRNKQSVLWALVIVNAVLLTVLCMRHFNTPAFAQNRPSDYLAVPAQLPGAPNGVVFLLDLNNRQLSAMTYDGQKLVTMPKLDLDPILNPPGPAPRR